MTRTKPLRSFKDVEDELDRVYAALDGLVQLRTNSVGAPYFRTEAEAAAMTPPPAAGDVWLVLETGTLYVQAATDLVTVTQTGRKRLALSGTLEAK